MNGCTVPSEVRLKAVAAKLATVLRERAQATEQLRRIPDDTIEAIRDAGLFKILQPKVFGGYEMNFSVFFDVAMTLSAACGSSGWVYSVLGSHNWHIGLFDQRVQQEIWDADNGTLVVSAYGPFGSITAVDGGYRLQGSWHFSSGCHHGQWVLLGGVATRRNGEPGFHTFLVPRCDWEIEDRWHVAGLVGTGSNTIVVKDAFVPAYRVHSLEDGVGGPGLEINTATIYRYPFSSVLSYTITSSIIGMAQGALDSHVQDQAKRIRQVFANESAAQNPFSQMNVAEASLCIDAAKLQMQRDIDEMAQYTNSNEEIPLELRLRLRRDQVQGTRLAIQAVNRIFENSGAHGLFLSNPIQRAWRDANAARVHAVNDFERFASLYGGAAMGIDPPKGTNLF